MRQSLVLVIAVCAVLGLAAAASAHHSFAAEFDGNKPTTKAGVVTKIEWNNPHVWFFVDVANEDGSVENWGFEMGPPHLLQGRGWTRTTMNIGDQVTVEGSLARDGSNRVNARTVTMTVTGERLGAGSSQNLTP